MKSLASLCSRCRRSIFGPRGAAFSTTPYILDPTSTYTRPPPPHPPRATPRNMSNWDAVFNSAPRPRNPKNLDGAIFGAPHVEPPTIKEGEGVRYFEEHVKAWTRDPKMKQLLLDFGIPEPDLNKLLAAYESAVSSQALSKDAEYYQLDRFNEQLYHRFSVGVLYSSIFFTWVTHPSNRSFLLDTLGISSSTLSNMQRLVDATDRRFMAEGYPMARRLHRKVIMHIGPTNSGKTYHALRALAAAPTGVYAGPLRLLAHEIWERLNLGQIAPAGSDDPSFSGTDITPLIDTLEHGPAIRKFGNPLFARLCNMRTGEEQKYVSSDAPLLSCTVEMLPYSMVVDVAVVDEIQMISDAQRGGGWTSAVVGFPARELHLCGEETAVPVVKKLLEGTGDELVIQRYERLTPLKVEEASLEGDWSKVQKGDCVVAFARSSIFGIKRKIEEATGLRCAVIYGRLPPEIRSEQAALFNDPDSGYDVLVGSDAIGMGLNLKIRRVVFDSLHKARSGGGHEPLSVSQVKQIAGRAGRFGMQTSTSEAPGGFATCLKDQDMEYLSQCLATPFTSLPFARIRFDTDSFTKVSSVLPPSASTATIVQAHHYVSPLPPQMRYHDHDLSMLPVCDFIDQHGGSLNAAEKVMHLSAPVSWRDPTTVDAVKRYMRDASERTYVDVEKALKETPFYGALLNVEKARDLGHSLRNVSVVLSHLESLHKALVVYIWMSFRMPVLYSQYPVAAGLKERGEKALQWALEKLSETVKTGEMEGKGKMHYVERAGQERRRGWAKVMEGAGWEEVMNARRSQPREREGELGRSPKGSRPHIPAKTKLGIRMEALKLQGGAQAPTSAPSPRSFAYAFATPIAVVTWSSEFAGSPCVLVGQPDLVLKCLVYLVAIEAVKMAREPASEPYKKGRRPAAQIKLLMPTFDDDNNDPKATQMTGTTEPIGRKDDTYYWFDTVEFLVGDVRFWLPQYPFLTGSKEFAEIYGLSPGDARDRAEGVVELKGVTATQFQTFIKFLLPVHLTSTTITFTKNEWLTILALATLWHFHEARKLAIQHLEGQLTELELITVGRAEYVPNWVLAGYKAIVRRPKGDTILSEEAHAIAGQGHEAIHRLWAIRYRLVVSEPDDALEDDSVENDLLFAFKEELDSLTATSLRHRTRSEIERDERDAEERKIFEEKEKAAEERAEMERRIEAERQELARYAAAELAAREQARLREEMGAARYEQRLHLEETLSSLQERIRGVVTSRESTQSTDERAEKKCKRCSKLNAAAIATLNAEAAALEAEVRQVALEEGQRREAEVLEYLGNAEPAQLGAGVPAPATT